MFLLDTSVLIYARHRQRVPSDRAPRSCGPSSRNGGPTAWSRPRCSRRSGSSSCRGCIEGLDGVTADYYDLFSPLLPVTDEILGRALTLDAPGLGSSDRVHAATCIENGLSTIVSADPAFDGLSGLQRVDPLDTRVVEDLLRM